MSDRREYEASIVLRDQRTDLAVLRIKGKGPFPYMEFDDSDKLEVGDLVLAIGDPFGVGQTVTQGIISALARTEEGISHYGFFIQTDAAINPGNSGGALVDMRGRLIGINSAIVSQTGSSVGIGFAIPSDMVKVVVATAKSGHTAVRRPWLGAGLQNVSKEIADSLNLDRPAGTLVTDVTPKSPAEAAGLKQGDLIVSVDGQPTDDVEAFSYRFATAPLGSEVALSVIRDSKPLTLTLKAEPAPDLPRDPVKIAGSSPFAGATVINISPAVAEEYSLDSARQGVVISDIDEASRAAALSLAKRRRHHHRQQQEDRDDTRSPAGDDRRPLFLEDQHRPRQSDHHHGGGRISALRQSSGTGLLPLLGNELTRYAARRAPFSACLRRVRRRFSDDQRWRTSSAALPSVSISVTPMPSRAAS